MTDRPRDFDGEKRQTSRLAPENTNSEQRDQDAQAQEVADEAIDRATSVLGLDESDKAKGGIQAQDKQDLVDHMKQMDRGNTVDMSAYAGEPNHDDNVDKYGKRNRPD